jgi:hypothetical protein
MSEQIADLYDKLRTAQLAFLDARLALEELDHTDVSDRLATRWFDVEAAQTRKGKVSSQVG